MIPTVEIDDEGRPGRTRLEVLPDYRAESIGRFVRANIAAGATLVSDGYRDFVPNNA